LAAFLDDLDGGTLDSARPRVPAVGRGPGASPLISSLTRTVANRRRTGAVGYR
jgi:hypothetical protein